MDPKKQRMIEESMKLFSEKGFHMTSIQEIADNSDVSKGGFYLHFQSKDELLVETYKYYTSLVIQKFENIRIKSKDPLEQFTEQIAAFLDMFKEHKEYLIMHFRDNIHLGDKMDDLIIAVHKQNYGWMKGQLYNIYGEKLEPFQVDIAIQLEGILASYIKWITIHNKQFDAKYLAAYITTTIDQIVDFNLKQGKKPIFQEKELTLFLPTHEVINDMKEKINQMEADDKQAATEAIHVLEEEWTKQEPKNIIIQSMIDHLASYPTLKESIQTLQKKK